MNVLAKSLESFLPNWDKERVYPSDVRKIFQWYHIIKQAGLFEATAEGAEGTEAPAKEAKVKAEPAKKKAAATAGPAKAAKPANVKKAAPVKTGSSRGK
jgi:hypothetical protein